MNGSRLTWDVAVQLFAGASLFVGLTRLDTARLGAALITLGAMAFLMFPAAILCGATGRPAGLRGKWQLNYTLRRPLRLHDKEKMNVRSKSKC
jgi:hypothetical protein